MPLCWQLQVRGSPRTLQWGLPACLLLAGGGVEGLHKGQKPSSNTFQQGVLWRGRHQAPAVMTGTSTHHISGSGISGDSSTRHFHLENMPLLITPALK